MADQKCIYVDADYLKELEEKGKRHDFFEGYIKGIEVAFAFAEELVKNISNGKEEPQKHCYTCETSECFTCKDYSNWKSSDDQQGLACDDDGTLSKAQSHLQKWSE